MKKMVILLMIITLLSKVTGFAREITLAYFYGASDISDAYFVSTIIPFVIFSFIGVGITSGYIPIFNKIEKNEGALVSNKFTSNLLNVLMILCTIIVIIVELFSYQIVKVFASGFEGEILNLAVLFTRITVLGIYFNVVITIYNGFLQMKNSFVIPAVFGFIFNLFIIISIYLSSLFNVILLAIGMLLALLFQTIFLLIYTGKVKKLKYRFVLDLKDKYIMNIGKLALPLTLGVSISQINVLIDKTIASRISTGGLSALNYADRLNSFILSTVVMSITVVIYPMLSSSSANNKINEFKKIISQSIISITLLLVPATVGAMIFVEPIVNVLFARGAFDSQAISMTSAALFFYSIGMVGIGLREVLSRAFFSMHDTKTPMVNAAIGAVLNIILNIILSKYLGVGGLALATSIAATFTTTILFLNLRKKIGSYGLKKITISFLKILFASLVMGLLSKLSFNYLIVSFSQNLSLFMAILIAGITYFATIYFLKIEDVDIIFKVAKRKLNSKGKH
ncbi:murein biosynthesis integral membrane protein MurJ [Lederbergia citrea]|uniref:Probable lipid II flippase MurJ n=1 Tax=Lederbergia citrea TaxID=2833581 RepID=A0A942UQT0_9BACI|nr:murein biosynthesis integral membrane protein MurJ [Lederbergia citrea]MBS4223346.1 murein biosynthesis integral membrane protein MurJ [Lederbergia citrea]